MSSLPLKLAGSVGSPYSRKMLSLMRFRRIPHVWVLRHSKEDADTPKVPVDLIPVVVFPGEDGQYKEAMIDSTFQIRRLEGMFEERSVIPPDPVMAFIDYLIEDFADEWLTKPMFHYRWAHEENVANAAVVLPSWNLLTASDEELAPFSDMISSRQVGRLSVVGCNEITGPMIEEFYLRWLRLMQNHILNGPYMMGKRPGTADFGIFGQMSQLVKVDPTSALATRKESLRIVAWMDVVEDLSGLEVSDDDWLTRDALPESLIDILKEIGSIYPQFLLANAAALERGDDQFECEIYGKKWVQQRFPYQLKCLNWLREAHAALSPDDCSAVDKILSGTGCEELFN